MKDKKLFLIDAYALIYRAYYAFIKNPIINSKGFDTSAIMGFFNSIFDILKREKPDYFAVAFDVGGSVDRYEIYEQYKANRDSTPEPILDSVPIIHEILDALGIKTLQLSGYEADDIIGTVAKQAEKEGLKTYMVTPDKDFAQLVSENIFLYKPARFGGGIEIWGIDEVKNKFEINHPLQVIDFLGMMGDSVDNIPGIPGVGEKTAKKFLKEYGSIEELYKNLEDIKGKLKEKISENKELGMLSKKLATIITDVPIDYKIEELKIGESNNKKILSIFDDLEFKRLKENYFKIFNQQENETAYNNELNFEKDNKNEENYLSQKLESEKGIRVLIDKVLSSKSVSIDYLISESNSYFSFCLSSTISYYINFNLKDISFTLNLFQEIFESKILKIIYDHKSFSKILKTHKIKIDDNYFDIKIANYLVDSSRRDDLESILKININAEISENQIHTRVSHIKKTYELLFDSLKLNGLNHLFLQIEMPLSRILMEMEYEGVKLDKSLIKKLSVQFENDLINTQNKIYNFCDKEFNLASPKQLGEVLFDDLKIESNPKKTKTGQYSTSEETLSKLSKKHMIVKEILDWRSLQKLMTTYINALPNQIDKKTERIHSVFNQTNTTTGRLSSNNPNLQNIPIRTINGRMIRRAFTAKEGSVIISADYSQIELRIMAHLSEDKELCKAFKDNLDIHDRTASLIYNVSLDDVQPEMRRTAKVINFGIMYGAGPFRISQELGISRKAAQEIIKQYFIQYSGIQNYIDDTLSKARSDNYVETILGRRRYVWDVNSENALKKQAAERVAINMPIQGSAAELIKIAMIDIQKNIENDKLKSKMILQIHDELLFEYPLDEEEHLISMVKKSMENAMSLKVPIIVDYGFGKDWFEAH